MSTSWIYAGLAAGSLALVVWQPPEPADYAHLNVVDRASDKAEAAWHKALEKRQERRARAQADAGSGPP